MLTDLKTTIGGVAALVAIGLLAWHKIDTQDALLVLGVAAGWIGITGADSGSKGSK